MQYNYRYLWYWWYLSVLNFCMLYIIVTELTPTLGTGEKIIKYQKKIFSKILGEIWWLCSCLFLHGLSRERKELEIKKIFTSWNHTWKKVDWSWDSSFYHIWPLKIPIKHIFFIKMLKKCVPHVEPIGLCRIG